MKSIAALLSCLFLSTLPLLAEDDIKVGQVASLTGGRATFGVASDEGSKLAIEEINAAGGVLGRKLQLITVDDQSKPGEPAAAAKKLLSSDKVVALLGEVASSASLEMAPVAQAAGIPMISPASTNPKVTAAGDKIFRICFIDPFQGTVMSKFALDTLKAKRVAILTDSKNDYSVGLTQFFKKHFTANGGEVVAERQYGAGDKDFRSMLTAIRKEKPDAIFVPGYYSEVALIAKQARLLGLKAPLLGGDGWDSPALLEVGGKSLEGCFFSNHYSQEDASPVIQDFIKRYKAKYNKVPDAMAALGYDSVLVLADAIKRAAGTDSTKLTAAIAATKGFVGVTGAITLDAERNATKSAVILEIKDGTFKYKSTVQP